MPAAMVRSSSQALHMVMGGAAVFCLWYAVELSDFSLLIDAFKYAGLASTILYFQHRYLDR